MCASRLLNPAFLSAIDLSETLITPLNYCTSTKGAFDDTTSQQMTDAIAQYAQVCNRKGLALFFHGGLVDKESGLKNARQLFGPYSDISAPAQGPGITSETWGNAYPYFFVWESGLWETLQHNLPAIAGEVIFRRILDIVGQKAHSIAAPTSALSPQQAMTLRAPSIGVVDGFAAVPTASENDIDEVHRAIEYDPIINAEKRRIARTARPLQQALSESLLSTTRTTQVSPVTLLSPEIVNAVVGEEVVRDHATINGVEALESSFGFGRLALGGGKVLIRIIQRYAQKRNHNFHNTVVEEIFREFYVANIGSAIWNTMKQETKDAFGLDTKTFVGARMVDELIKLYESGTAGKAAVVTLVGHSTGSIYICNFLDAMAEALKGKVYASKIQFNIIFLAAAVRVDVFAATLSKHRGLIREFRSFGMHDTLEAQELLIQADGPPDSAINTVLGQIYTSSLLYFIAGVLEEGDDDTPLVGMERYFTGAAPFATGEDPSIDDVQRYLSARPHGYVHSDTSGLKPQPALGLRSASHHHGGFPGENGMSQGPGPGTLESTCYLLRTNRYG